MKKDIKKAIKEHLYANTFVTDSNNPGFVDRFFEHTKAAEWGANWRINSVWHSNNRTYKAQKTALVIFKNGKSKVYDNLTDLTIESLWGEVDRFAYIEDLLPNMED